MFDPYSEWLGLTDERRPPTLYQLAGIPTTESDPQVIEAAVTRQLAKVQSHLAGSKAKIAWQIVDELALAKSTLLDPAKRAAYDLVFGTGPKQPPPHMVAPAPAQAPVAPVLEPLASHHPAPAATSFNLEDEDENESPSDDAIPTMTFQKRAKQGQSTLLLVGGGVMVLGLVGAVVFFATGGKPKLPDALVKELDAGDSAKQQKQPDPPSVAKKESPKETKDKIPVKKTSPAKSPDTSPKKIEPPPKTDPPPSPKPETIVEFKESKIFKGNKKTALGVAISPNGKQFLSVDQDKVVNIWSAGSEMPANVFSMMSEGVGAAFLPGGKEAIVADGSMCYLIDLANKDKKREFKTEIGGVVAIALATDGKHFLSLMQTGQLLWWDVENEKPVSTIPLTGINSPLNCLALTGDGKTAIVGDRIDGMVSLWNLTTQKPIRKPWQAHNQDVTAVAFSPDGKRVATAGQDKLVKVWDVGEGKNLLTLKGHTDVPLALCYSSDGALIFSAGIDQSVRVWDASSGAPLPSVFMAQGKIFSLAVDPKGRFVVAGISGGAMQLFVLPENAPKNSPVTPP